MKLSDKILKQAKRINGADSNGIDAIANTDEKEPEKEAIEPGSMERSKVSNESDHVDEKEVEASQDTDKDSVQKRINKVIAQKKGKEEELERVRKEFDDYKRQNSNPAPGKESANPKNSPASKGAPKVSDFKSVDEWSSAFEQHTRDNMIKEIVPHIQKQREFEKANDYISNKFKSLIDKGRGVAEQHGVTADEYEDRVSSKDIQLYRDAQKELLESPHGHLIALDIANDMDNWGKLTEKGASAQMKYIGKREAFHEMNFKDNGMTSANKQRTTTKASSPDTALAQGFGHANDENGFSTKKGDINWKAVRKYVKNR